jgi:hypothetical protein
MASRIQKGSAIRRAHQGVVAYVPVVARFVSVSPIA